MAFTRLIITFTGEAAVNDTMTITTNKSDSYAANVQKVRVFANQISEPVATGTTGEGTAIAYSSALISDNVSFGQQLGGQLDISQSSNVITLTFYDSSVNSATFGTTGSVTSTSSTDTNGVIVTYPKINARSPHWYRVQEYSPLGTLTSALIKLKIYEGNQSSWGSAENWTYQLSSIASNSEVLFNISELIKDYVPTSFDGSYYSKNPFVDIQVVSYYDGIPVSTEYQFTRAFYGYGYFEEGINPELNNSYLQSNNKILKLADSPVIIPVDRSITQSVTYLNQGEQVYTKLLFPIANSGLQIEYLTNGVNGADSFENRVIQAGGIFENSICLSEFEGEFELLPVDTIHVAGTDGLSIVTVETVDECKYEPYKLTFINKFGALQDMWFFKASSLSIDTSKEDFRRNTMSGLSYSVSDHQYKNLFKGGREKLTINSGFYPESYNDVFRQLLLSEDCWIEYKNQTLPVNISDSSKKFKTNLMDKLISYQLELDFAYDKINTIN
tara:strand:- start:319 stop:1818 length:1500 start_codon:yes stop_codon:yes gene_type:complete